MIPRYQRYLFWALAAGIVTALAFLLYGCRQAEKRLAAPQDETPIAAPTSNGQETVPLALANDTTGEISFQDTPLALPAEPSTRARVLLEQLLARYALPGSAHPLPSGQGVDDVFLVALPLTSPAAPIPELKPGRHHAVSPAPIPSLDGYTGRLAVINFHGSFAENHPSGVEVEALTLDSILATLHANFPEITEVRFLVDGHARETLAGHADLSRPYPTNSIPNLAP